MLAILAVALAMLGDAHLLAVRRFNERFLSYALAQHQDLSLRGPTLQEILSADKDVSALLQPRPKASAPILASVLSPTGSLMLIRPIPLLPAQPRRLRRILTTRRNLLLQRHTTKPGPRR